MNDIFDSKCVSPEGYPLSCLEPALTNTTYIKIIYNNRYANFMEPQMHHIQFIQDTHAFPVKY